MRADWRRQSAECDRRRRPISPLPRRLSVRLSRPALGFPREKGTRLKFARRATGTVSFLTPVWSYVDALVHPAARQDALTAARHRAFIAPRLLGSLLALASFPVYLALRGVPSALEVGVFAWLVAPILIAYFLSRTGRYDSAHVLSSLSLTGLVATVAWCTGGIASFAAIWLVVVPLEAALSASRRVVAMASTFALAAAGLAAGAEREHAACRRLSLPITHGALAALGIISAALYATGLALGAEVAGAHQLLAALCRGGPLPAARAQHDRRHHPPRPQRRGAVRLAGGRAVVRRARATSCWATACSTACMSPTGRPISPRSPTRRRRGEAVRSNSACAATDDSGAHGHFIWVEMRCRPLDRGRRRCGGSEREVVAVLRDVSERKTQEQALELARARSRARQCRQEPLPRHHEPRAAHAAQRHHRLLRNADERDADARCRAQSRICAADQRIPAAICCRW